jgi:tetratricopeptide (TPR) repeat protein
MEHMIGYFTGTQDNADATGVRFGFNLKPTFNIGQYVSLFPLLGVSYPYYITASGLWREESHWLNDFSLYLGAGFDVSLTKDLYIRTEGLFELGNSGGKFSVAVGHRTENDPIRENWKTPAEKRREDGEAAYKRGKTALNAKNYKDAVKEFSNAIKLYPTKEAYLDRGSAYANQDKLDASIEDYKKAVSLDPNYTLAHQNLATNYKKQGKIAEEISEQEEILRLIPTSLEAYERLDYLKAPQEARAAFDRGLLAETKNPVIAVEEYSKALALHPAFVCALINRGLIYVKAGEYDKAIADDTAALRIKSNYSRAQTNLASAQKAKADAQAKALALAQAMREYNALIAKGTYYVSAQGDDSNDGLSEKTPFKTLSHAVSEVKTIRVITVIGTLNNTSENAGKTDGDYVFPCTSNTAIVITGKPDATGSNRAVLSAAGTNKAGVDAHGSFRFQYIEISGSPKYGLMINIVFTLVNSVNEVTLGDGAAVRNNTGRGVWIPVIKEFKDFYQPGSLILDGGLIENNKTTNLSGAGVYVGGTFTMKRGSIRNNQVIGKEYGGGGIFVDEGATLTISGGDISGNTAYYGGGIFSEGSVTMTGGVISGNSGTGGGGVGIYGGTFTMSGGAISGNSSSTNAGGVVVTEGAVFTIQGGSITGNKAAYDGGGIMIMQGGTVNGRGGTISGNTSSSRDTADIYFRQ